MMPAEPRRFIHLFGGPRETSDLVGIARACCREGYAVLPIEPGGKKAICTLTPRQAVAADRMAANAARESGRRHWEHARHACGLSHAITDPKDAERIFRRLVEKHPDLNIALECAESRLICVDCDNGDEVRSFTELWAEREGIPELANAAPTVRTPGKVDESGTWVHRDGGHYWFLLPDDVDFTDTPISTSLPIGLHEAKAQIRYGRSYALVPPSVREEGPYTMASDIGPCPGWLVDILRNHVNGVRERRDQHLSGKDGSDPIDVWSSLTTWEDLLGGDGWTTRNRPDNCGCPVWTRPGEWTNPKSATAHEPGCIRWDTDDIGHGFLHVWTDNAPDFIAAYRAATGHSSLSKLQYVAWRDFNGDSSAAMRALGISSNAEPAMSDDDIFAAAQEAMEAQGKEHAPPATELPDSGASSESATDDDEDSDPELSPFDKLRAEFISAADLDKIPPLTPLVEGIFDFKTTTRIIGQSGHGKTFVMLDMAAHVITGRAWQGRECAQGRVAYIVAEGIAGFTQRVRAWERYHGVELGDGLMVLPRPVQAGNAQEWAVLVEVLRSMKPAMVVIDTQARVTVGMEESSATEMGIFIDRADRIKIATSACVVLVHHQGHSGEHGRGSSAVLGALDVEIAVAKEGKGGVAVMSSKQKDREDFDPIRLRLHQVEVPGFKDPSAVIVSREEEVGDGPLLDDGINEESSTRDRLAKIMHDSYEGGYGYTKAEWWVHVKERDRGPKGVPMSRGAYYKAWDKLSSDGVLVMDETEIGKRFSLSPSEAVRLQLAEASYGR